MNPATQVWDDYVARGLVDSDSLLQGVTELIAETMGRDAVPEMAYIAFSIAAQSLLLGTEQVGRLGAAIEHCFALLYDGKVDTASALPLLASSIETMGKAFAELHAADQSGARIEKTPLDAAIYELETLFPVPGAAPAPRKPTPNGPDVLISQLVRAKPKAETNTDTDADTVAGVAPEEDVSAEGTDGIWEPEVDEDMLDLFFEEVNDRIEALSIKLLEIEQRPQDIELLRDVFRDWHTIKGSAAMVNLIPMTKLAHAAEDLVGQLREGQRSATSPVIDALLASLDALRTITTLAQSGLPISIEIDSVYLRLQNPEAHTNADEPLQQSAPVTAQGTEISRGPSKATIRVDFDKLDSLMNLVGELVLGRDGLGTAIGALASLTGELASRHQLSGLVTKVLQAQTSNDLSSATKQAQLQHLGEELNRVERVLVEIFQDLDTSSGRLDSISADLRNSVMSLRMISVGGILRKHHRTVRDLARSLGKEIQLELQGEDVEFDKLLVEALDEPLMHLMRNAVDHGIEMPEDRERAGKSPTGKIILSAMHKGNQVVIEIEDDGKGIDAETIKAKAQEKGLVSPDILAAMTDKEALDLIFHAGFSTSDKVSEVSGRGVGMDVVRQTIIHRLKGGIEIRSTPGVGSTFTLKMPLTLAIAQVLLARAGGEILAIPLDAVARTLVIPRQSVQLVQDREVIIENNKQVPLIRINEVLALDTRHDEIADVLSIVLCQHGDSLYGLVVEALLEKKEIVIKSLGDVLEEVPCIAGSTLIGDSCAVILDIPAVLQRAIQGGTLGQNMGSDLAAVDATSPASTALNGRSILLVEDSDTVRESLRRLLTEAGYRVVVARDGVEGFAVAKQEHFDLVSTDVMMPRMDGYELTRALRQEEAYKDTPIIMVTSRGERIDRVRGFDAGVDEYITKPHDRHLLLRSVKKLLGDA